MLVHGHEVSLRSIVESWVGIVVGLVTILGAIAAAVLWATSHFVTAQQAAWMAWSIADGRATQMRNRVNDCDIRKENPPPMSQLERAACTQYRDEYTTAATRAEEALRYAKELSR